MSNEKNTKAIVRVFNLWAKIAMMIVDGTREAKAVADILQTILEPQKSTAPQAMLTIDRSMPFDFSTFSNTEGWKTVEQDERALSLTKLDLSRVELETTLRDGETSIKGEEKHRRLQQDGRVLLDAAVFQALWENQQLIPASWKGKCIYLDGTILQRPNGRRCVLCLYRSCGQWDWNYNWLEGEWIADLPSALLAS